MTVAAVEQRIEQILERRAPGGLWDTLARAVDAPPVGACDIWRDLERRMRAGGPPPRTGLWEALARRVDPAQYCPHAVPDVAEEPIVDGEQRFTIIRSPRGTYLRLTDAQREIWHQMDGTRTVAQLATQAFLKCKQLLPVGELVAVLRDEGFLIDRPVGVYRAAGAALEARTAEGWGRRVLRALMGKTWQFQDIDGLYGKLYRVGGRLLFTRAFAAIWVAVALAGMVAFVLMLIGARPAPPLVGGTVPLELAGLWCALLIAFLLHESAHALSVKHFGRTLSSGGMLLYFGTPAFFVDTSDIWRAPRRARMLVSAAGPMADLFVGGIAALVVLYGAATAAATEGTPYSVLYKLAVTCYIATLFNANPLLELDGYFILVDALRLPDLRRRAIAFVRGPLWRKVAQRRMQHKTAAKREAVQGMLHPGSFILHPFSRQERFFTIYGALTLLYAVVAVVFAVQFWNKHLVESIRRLWASDDPFGQALAAALLLLVVLPVLAGLLIVALATARAALAWVLRRGYGRQPALLAGMGVGLALGGAWAIGGAATGVASGVVVGVWGGALAALLAVRPDYRGAAIAPTLNALALMAGLAALAAIVRITPAPPVLWLLADGLAFVFLLVAGLAALLDVELHLLTPPELTLTALLLMLAFAVGGVALAQLPRGPEAARIAAAAPAYFGALALALLLPRLFDLRDSRLVWSWGLVWLAALAQTAAFVAQLGGHAPPLHMLAAGLWAAAWLVHLATLRQIAPDEIAWLHEPSISEEQRLARAFQRCYAGCYRLLRAVYGARRARALDDRMDVLAATANWDVTLDHDRARIAPAVLALPLDLQGARYAEVLRYSVATIEAIAGATFARRAIQAAYDALPWPERETAGRSCFPDTPWARALSDAFGDLRAARLRLLRQIDQFLACDDEDLDTLAHVMAERHSAAGEELWRAGTLAPGVWVVEAGEVVAMRGEQLVAELHRGDSFGAAELIAGAPADVSYRAAIGSSLLLIPAEAFNAVVRDRAPPAGARRGAAETLQLLERVPLFADLPRTTLRGLAHVAARKRFPARTVIIRQGTPSGVFYVIAQGRVAVLARGRPKGDARANIRQVAQLGAEEFFGELELLRGTPPVASVVALTPLVVLALPHAAIQACILGDGRVAKGLEQVGTGRLRALRGAAIEI